MIGKILEDVAQRMRIGIDAHAAERDGSGNCTYISNLLLALQDIDRRNDYVLYATEEGHPFYENFSSNDRFLVKQLPIKNPFFRIPVFLAAATYRDNLDILHVQYNAPPIHKGKLVVTIHDLSFLHFPKFFSKFEEMRLKVLTPLAARKASKVITGSRFSQSDIIEAYNLEPSKVETISHGASSYKKAAENVCDSPEVLRKYEIKKPFLLFVGRLNQRKNLKTLIAAFLEVKKVKSIPHMLIIAGKIDYNTKETLQALKDAEACADIKFTGFVPEEDLMGFYSQAEVFIYPSLFEGVGLPVLEAMQSGVPVITSNTSSLREIAGDAALTVNPLDIDEMGRGIYWMINDQKLRDEYITKGRTRVKAFSWKSNALQTLKVYQGVMSSD